MERLNRLALFILKKRWLNGDVIAISTVVNKEQLLTVSHHVSDVDLVIYATYNQTAGPFSKGIVDDKS